MLVFIIHITFNTFLTFLLVDKDRASRDGIVNPSFDIFTLDFIYVNLA